MSEVENMPRRPLLVADPHLPCLPRLHWGPARQAAPHFAHLLYVLAGKDTGLPACCEVAVNLERVPGAALVGVNPVLACAGRRGVSARGGAAALTAILPPPNASVAHHQAGLGG